MAEAIDGVEGSTRHNSALEATKMTEATTDAAGDGGADLSDAGGSSGSAGGGRRGGPKAPSKFMADLTKAMQAAAESAREEALSRLAAEAKASIEEIHVRSATDSAELRRQTDEDIAGIREWSKAEIARVREETDEKIAARKGRLETDIEEHGATIERQIERVQGRVTSYEGEMAEFFARLLAEQDPSRFASLAENVPEPPSLSAADLAAHKPAKAAKSGGSRSGSGSDVAVAEPSVGSQTSTEDAFAAIEAAAQAEEWHDTANGAGGPSTEFEGGAFQPESEGSGGESAEDDPRLAALAMSQDFAAAEAEAAAAVGTAVAEEIPTIGDDALAARLAGLVPAGAEGSAAAPAEPQATQVVVVGLVSVASIASFKRHLGRLAGVQSVGVSSGPDGEFVFAVHHAPDVVLRELIPSLPGFQARVTGGAGGTIQVTARDPESEA